MKHLLKALVLLQLFSLNAHASYDCTEKYATKDFEFKATCHINGEVVFSNIFRLATADDLKGMAFEGQRHVLPNAKLRLQTNGYNTGYFCGLHALKELEFYENSKLSKLASFLRKTHAVSINESGDIVKFWDRTMHRINSIVCR